MIPTKSLGKYKVGEIFDTNPTIKVSGVEKSIRNETVSMEICWKDRATNNIRTMAYVKGTVDFFPGPLINPSDKNYEEYNKLFGENK